MNLKEKGKCSLYKAWLTISTRVWNFFYNFIKISILFFNIYILYLSLFLIATVRINKILWIIIVF